MKHYQQKNLVSEKVGEETLIIDHEKGNLITLNRTAGFIWDFIKQPKKQSQIVIAYAKRFGKEKENDAREGLLNLVKAKVTRVTEEP